MVGRVGGGEGREKKRKDVLDSASSDAGPEPLPYVRSELLSRERHAVDAEWRMRRRRVEEPRQYLDVCGVFGRWDGMRRAAPIFISTLSQLSRTREEARKNAPRPRRTPTSALANKLWPVRNIHPHPVSALHVRSCAHGHTFLPAVGLRLSPPAPRPSDIPYPTPSSRRANGGEHGGRSASRASRIGLGRCER